ncbi:hypothetical protein [Streptomyces sp. NBC_01262]|uniref:hypothetical protein n=1 Tax=Streptomyces sp. NBC_01262 TaxID=2903803 RepID=UPI002E323DA9|nr:hypothetical protein [Streptomyces sp. NBC_01262]
MIFTYSRQGAEPQRWDLSEVRFLSSEAEAVERTTGLEWGEVLHWRTLVDKVSPTARRGLLWILLKRSDPTLRYSACDPVLAEMDVKLGAKELAELRAEAEQALVDGKISEEGLEAGIRELESVTDPGVLAAVAAMAAGPKAGVQAVADAGAPTAGEPWTASAPTASPTGAPPTSGPSSSASPA